MSCLSSEVQTSPTRLIRWQQQTSAGFTLRGEHSEPSGKPVIHFLHGTGFCARTYWPLLHALQDDFDLFLSNVQGHGDSDAGPQFLGWNRTAELALEAWRAHAPLFAGVAHFALGHSFGGAISALMLAQEPDQFERAVLMDPILFPRAMLNLLSLARAVGLYQHHSVARRVRKRRAKWPDRATARTDLHERGMFKGWSAEALQAHVDYALKDTPDGVALKCAPSREAELFGSLPRHLWRSLSKVKTPLLLEYSATSYPFIARAARDWHAQHPGVQVESVPGGHCYMQENPIVAARRIQDYLSATR